MKGSELIWTSKVDSDAEVYEIVECLKNDTEMSRVEWCAMKGNNEIQIKSNSINVALTKYDCYLWTWMYRV